MSEPQEASAAREKPIGDPTICSRRVRSIESVVQSSGRFRFDAQEVEGKLSASLLERPAIVRQEEETIIVLSLFFSFEARPLAEDRSANSSVEEPAAVEVDASYEIKYRLSEGDPVSDEDLQAFGDINGRLNLTPYWRAYLHDCLNRAGLPPFLIPPFNAAARIAQLKQQSREDQEQSST